MAAPVVLLLLIADAHPRVAHGQTVRAYVGAVEVSVIDTATNIVIATVPMNGGAIAGSPDGTAVYMESGDTVAILDTASNALVGTVPDDQHPIGIAFTPDGTRAYVANFSTPGSVSVIDTDARTVLATIPIAAGPYGVAVTRDGTFAYVTQEVFNPGYLSVISTATNTVTTTITVGANPRAIVMTPDGASAYVANGDSDSVSVVDIATNSVVATVPTGPKPVDLAITRDGTRVYVANEDFNSVGGGNITAIDTASNTVATVIPTGGHPVGVSVTPDGAFVYFGTTGCCGGPTTVSVIDVATSNVTTTIPVDGNPIAIAMVVVPASPTPTPTGPPTLSPTVTPTPTATPLCLATPRAGCRTPGRSRFRLESSSGGKLTWEWLKGAATDLAALGNPVAQSTTSYVLCVYESSGGTPNLAMGAAAPGGTLCGGHFCWRPTGTKEFKYIDPSGSRDGLVKILLQTGDDGKAKMLVKANGANLPLPMPADPNNLLRQDPFVTVQLVNSDAECWEASYQSPALKVAGDEFKDRIP